MVASSRVYWETQTHNYDYIIQTFKDEKYLSFKRVSVVISDDKDDP